VGIGIGLPASADVLESANLVDELIAQTRQAADAGVAGVWFTQRLDIVDAIALAGLAGREVPGVQVGSAGVPIYPRHPIVVAGQARTAAAASGGRFTLGIGLGVNSVLESVYGTPHDRPIGHLRDHLTALGTLLDGGTASVHGPTLTADTGATSMAVPGAGRVPVVVAAMGPQALRVTGALADGTMTYLAGPKTLTEHVVPTVTSAAEAAGRPAPRIIAGLAAVVTADPAGTWARAEREMAYYLDAPSYRAVLAREGAEHPVELAAIGDEDTLAEHIARYFAAGATDVVVARTGMGTPDDRLRTWEALGRLNAEVRRRGVKAAYDSGAWLPLGH
jgi:F420-dependent oxidoreductase-like protein